MHYLPWVMVAAAAFLAAVLVLKLYEYWFVNHKIKYLKRQRRLRVR